MPPVSETVNRRVSSGVVCSGRRKRNEMSEELPSEQSLMQRICRQDPDAFEAIYARYQAVIRQHLLRTVRETSASEDLTQEVFLRVWTRAEQWNGSGALRAWLLRIATNLALNHLRSVKRRRERPLELPADPDEETAAVPFWLVDTVNLRPEEALEQSEWRQRLVRLVNDLPMDKRTVFHMVYEADMEPREVASVLGIPEGTVRSRLHYARKQIRSAWERENTE